MKGIIMAGGEGSRLRPLTCDLPKPMVPVMNQPVMTYSIALLKKHGIEEIGATLQYLPEAIRSYFSDGGEWGVNLHYFVEESPLGTAGSVKNAGEFLDETFVVISGDALTDIDLTRAAAFHRTRGAKATLVLKRVAVPLEYGVVVTGGDGAIERFLEKPGWGEVFSDTVNTGIYILEPEVLDYFEAGRKFDFSQDLFPLLMKDKQPLYGYITEEYWCDIGNSDTYLTAHYDMLGGQVRFPMPGRYASEGIWVGAHTIIEPGAVLEGPCFIGEYARIQKGAYVGPESVIGDHCTIAAGASMKRSVLWDHCSLGKDSSLRGAALCAQVTLMDQAVVYEGAVIGDRCRIGAGAVIKPGVKVWPEKTIEAHTVVRNNCVWGSRVTHTLFGKDGVRGTVNGDLTPQTMGRLGGAFGAYLTPGNRAAVACDGRRGNQMLKHGLIGGLLSAGLEVFDLGTLTGPLLRYGVRHLGLEGGVYLASDGSDPRRARLHFTDRHGCSLPPAAERKMETLYSRDDFSRQAPEELLRVHTVSDLPIFYLRSLIESLDTAAMKKRSLKVAAASENRIGGYLLLRILKETGCQVDTVPSSALSQGGLTGYDLVLRLREDGESFVLYDEGGQPLLPESAQALIGLIYLKEGRAQALPLPNTAPEALDNLAKAYNCRVVRTKSSRQAWMEAALAQDLQQKPAGLSLFQLFFDGTAALIKLVELICRENTDLPSLLKEIPVFHMREKEINCPWDQKGRVMRSLIESEQQAGRDLELFEGIRVRSEKGWALILPDAEDPVCRVYSEGSSEEFAEELAVHYAQRIDVLRRS